MLEPHYSGDLPRVPTGASYSASWSAAVRMTRRTGFAGFAALLASQATQSTFTRFTLPPHSTGVP